MSKYHNDRSLASDPVRINVSDAKLRQFHPELYGWRSKVFKIRFVGQTLHADQFREMIAEHMQLGDSRAAVVVKLSPLIVAAYTDEQDAVLLLQFSDDLATEYGLQRGAKLLTVNTYFATQLMAPDITEGPQSTGRYANFYPIIAEFVSSDDEAIRRRKRAIAHDEWQRAGQMALACMAKRRVWIRDGRPLHSVNPGTVVERTG